MSDDVSDFRNFFAGFQDQQYPNDDPTEDSSYTRLRDFWTVSAVSHSVGNRDAWDPLAGFGANKDRIIQLYDYYRDLFNSNEPAFLWAGLGRMAGGAVLGGLRFLLSVSPDPSFTTDTMVLIGKQIFLDLAWQHELFNSNSQQAITAAQRHDARFPAKSSYAAAWTAMASGDPGQIAGGNQMLLSNEQFSIIQPLYDAIKNEPSAAGAFASTRAFTSNVHPYHLDFETAMPGGDVTNADDRWTWITQPGGMWDKWVIMPAEERHRLVNLSIEDIIAQRWGTTIQSLLPPGSP
jgi:hypothetical protein